MAEYELMDESEIPEGSNKIVTLDGIEIGGLPPMLYHFLS